MCRGILGRRRGGLVRQIALSQNDGELLAASFGGIVEGFSGAIALAGTEIETLLNAVGKAGEAGFAIDVGVDFEIEFMEAPSAVGDVNFHFGVVDGLAVDVGDGEVGGAGTDAGIEGGNGVRVDSGSGLGIGLGAGERSEGEEDDG